MIIVHINGGLGNQLFQYAAARRLAAVHHTEVKMDVRELSSNALRAFSLSAFKGVDVNFATTEEVERLRKPGLFFKVANRLKPVNKRSFFREVSFRYDSRFNLLQDNVYIKGYWQCEQYFLDIENKLRHDFQLKESFIQNVTGFATELSAVNSVALHIRRGDYTNKESLAQHGLLPFSYYERAIVHIEETVDHPHYFIFSDDSNWVKSNFPLPVNHTLVSGEITRSQYEDLFLMSKCRHNIIANSSFSWWGGWLNEHKEKIVIAPKQWFARRNEAAYDIVPAHWIRL